VKFSSEKLFDTFFFTLIFIWCIGILWEVVIHFFPNLIVALPFLKYNYSIVCHQEPEKLFSIGNYKTLVCSRCTGIYFGALFSSIIALTGLIRKTNTKVLLFSSIPMFIDVVLYSFGLYSYSKTIALFTGLLLGSVGFI
jgi:uncharacterized membrane protein